MTSLKKTVLSLILIVSFVPASFAGDISILEFEYFVLTDMVVEGEVNTRGIVGLSYLAKVDPVSGKVRVIGTTGFINCSALDFNPQGALYATCERAAPAYTPVLVHLDPMTGQGTEIGEMGVSQNMSDIAITPDGKLFAYEELEASDNFHEMDNATGAANFIGNPGLEGQGNALIVWGDIAKAKLFTWIDGANQVYELDTDTAEAKFITDLQVFDITDGVMTPIGVGPCIMIAADALRAGVAGGVVITDQKASGDISARGAIVNTPFEAAAIVEMPINVQPKGASRLEALANKGLAFIDLDAGVAVVKTQIEPGFYIEGLAVRQIEPRSIPALSEWGLIATATALFAFALVILVRRKKAAQEGK